MLLDVSRQGRWLIGGLLVLLGAAATASAAPPKLNYLFPAGGQRGAEVVASASGEFSTWPVDAWTDRAGVSIQSESEKGKLRIKIDPQAVPGVCWIRLTSPEGASSLRPFFIDQLPEVAEAEPNDVASKPQAVAAQQVVNGRLNKAADVDSYAVTLAKGQTLVASLQAHSVLASPIDGVLQICEVRERTFSSVAGAPSQVEAHVLLQNNDAVGLDPQLVLTAPRDGTYLVRVFGFASEPNSTIGFAGSEASIYRLTLSTAGLADHALPHEGGLRLFGPGLAEAGVVAERAGAVALAAGVPGVAPVASGKTVRHDGQPLKLEAVTEPVTIVGRLAAQGARHSLSLPAKKGQAVELQVRSQSLGYPLDAVLTVTDASGKVLQQIDDVSKQPDPVLAFNPPADGDYQVSLKDLHGRGGPRYVYWLDVRPATPSFTLSLAAEALVVAAGKTVEIPVTIDRQRGHAAPIAITATGAGGGPLPAGITVAEVKLEGKGDSAKAVKLVVTAAADATPSNTPIVIVGRAEGIEPQAARVADAFPLADVPAGAWLTVTK